HACDQKVVHRRQHHRSPPLVEEDPWPLRAKGTELVLREGIHTIAELQQPGRERLEGGKDVTVAARLDAHVPKQDDRLIRIYADRCHLGTCSSAHLLPGAEPVRT